MIHQLLMDYDLRDNSGNELRLNRHSFGNVYSIVSAGHPAVLRLEFGGYLELLGMFTIGMDEDAIGNLQVVSKSDQYRYRRNRKSYLPPTALVVEYHDDYRTPSDIIADEHERREAEYESSIRTYSRSLETVSELLPDYHIALRDILPDSFPPIVQTVSLEAV